MTLSLALIQIWFLGKAYRAHRLGSDLSALFWLVFGYLFVDVVSSVVWFILRPGLTL
jgi:hypothetical protein